MSKMSLDKGRVRQKLKTRQAILHAAKELMQEQSSINLEQVADRAQISRATIYRYFPSAELLMRETDLDVHHHSAEVLQEEVDLLTLPERIYYIQNHFNELTQAHEAEFRRYLSAAIVEVMHSKKKLRGARRVKGLKAALQPFSSFMSAQDMLDLVHLCTMMMGAEAMVVCKDVCDLNNEQSKQLLRRGVELILKGMELDLAKDPD